jgi:hypothetical protein
VSAVISNLIEIISKRGMRLKKVYIEVIGPNPPCAWCTALWKNAERAASALKSEQIDVILKKVNIMSREVISKYGAVMSPGLALNGTLKVMGRVPDAKEIEGLIRQMA